MRTLIRTAVVWVAVLLAACAGGGQAPTPAPTTPTPTASSASPTPKPSPTPSPSPSPTSTLDADQTAARDVVLKYYELQNHFGMDPSLKDLTELTNITSGDAQLFAVESIDYLRQQNLVQTAPAVVAIVSVGLVSQDSQSHDVVQVTGCLDATNVDVVNAESGVSVLDPATRRPINLVTIDVVRANKSWLVNDVAVTTAEACP